MSPEYEVPSSAVFNRVMHNGHDFMEVMSISNPIRAIMGEVGYTDDVHRQGWELYMGLRTINLPWSMETLALPQKHALEALHKYVKDIFPRGRAALVERCPEQYRYIFEPIDRQEGIDPVAAVEIFADRTEVLFEGSDPLREGSREEDRQAILLLESRYIIDSGIRARLAGHLERAKTLASTPDNPEDLARFMDLYRNYLIWLKDWRRTARHSIKNRRLLIQLGLIKSRSRKKQVKEAPVCPASEGSGVICPLADGGDSGNTSAAADDTAAGNGGDSGNTSAAADDGATGNGGDTVTADNANGAASAGGSGCAGGSGA